MRPKLSGYSIEKQHEHILSVFWSKQFLKGLKARKGAVQTSCLDGDKLGKLKSG